MSNLKPGDKVKIDKSRCPERLEDVWVEEMNKYSKGIYTINNVSNEPEGLFFNLSEDPIKYSFPANCAILEEEGFGVKYDKNKLLFSLIPPEAETMVAAVLTIGALKYSPENWRKIENIPIRYNDACRRHINSFSRDEFLDQESGLPHTAHAICCLLFILQKEIEEKIGKKELNEFISEKIQIFSEKLDKNI